MDKEEKIEWLPAEQWVEVAEENTATDAMRNWLKRATKPVRYPPDRRRVRKELAGHIDERTEGFIKRGMSLGDARRQALERMGSPEETGALLRLVHKPWLGWCLCVFRGLTVLLLLAFLLVLGSKKTFLSQEQAMEKLGLHPNTQTVFASRDWHCDGAFQYDACSIKCKDVVLGWAVDRGNTWVDTLYDEYGRYSIHQTSGILLQAKFAPWNRNENLPYAVMRIVDDKGTEYGIYGIYTARIRPWAEWYYLEFSNKVSEAEWLDLYWDYNGNEQRMRIMLGDWSVKNLDVFPKRASATLNNRSLAQWMTEGEESSTAIKLSEAASGPISLCLYVPDAGKMKMEPQVNCTVVCEGATEQLPVIPSMLRDRLRIVDPSQGTDGKEIEYEIVDFDVCEGRSMWRLSWEPDSEAENYVLEYRQSTDASIGVMNLDLGRRTEP